MRKIKTLLSGILASSLLFGSTAFTSGASADDGSTIVRIPDPGLEEALRQELRIFDLPLTRDDLRSLQSLDAQDFDIRSLEGLQFATNLTGLYASENPIADLSPLAGLTRLTYMTLHDPHSLNTPVSDRIELDLRPLAAMTGMKLLYVTGYSIPSIEPLSGMKLMNNLSVGATPGVRSLEPLSGMSLLERLSIEQSAIDDLTPIDRLTGLESLYLNGGNIKDVAPLRNLTKLTYLNLDNNLVADISPLSDLKELNVISLGNAEDRPNGNRVSDLSPLRELHEIYVLDVRNNEVDDIAALVEMRKNETLTAESILYLMGNRLIDDVDARNLNWLSTRVDQCNAYPQRDAEPPTWPKLKLGVSYAGNGKISLKWDRARDRGYIEFYTVYVNGQAQPRQGMNAYTHYNAPEKKWLQFRIDATDGAGNSSQGPSAGFWYTTSPVFRSARNYLPVSDFARDLGYSVIRNDKSTIVSLAKDGHKMTFSADASTVTVDGKKRKLGNPSLILKGRLHLTIADTKALIPGISAGSANGAVWVSR